MAMTAITTAIEMTRRKKSSIMLPNSVPCEQFGHTYGEAVVDHHYFTPCDEGAVHEDIDRVRYRPVQLDDGSVVDVEQIPDRDLVRPSSTLTVISTSPRAAMSGPRPTGAGSRWGSSATGSSAGDDDEHADGPAGIPERRRYRSGMARARFRAGLGQGLGVDRLELADLVGAARRCRQRMIRARAAATSLGAGIAAGGSDTASSPQGPSGPWSGALRLGSFDQGFARASPVLPQRSKPGPGWPSRARASASSTAASVGSRTDG